MMTFSGLVGRAGLRRSPATSTTLPGAQRAAALGPRHLVLLEEELDSASILRDDVDLAPHHGREIDVHALEVDAVLVRVKSRELEVLGRLQRVPSTGCSRRSRTFRRASCPSRRRRSSVRAARRGSRRRSRQGRRQ